MVCGLPGGGLEFYLFFSIKIIVHKKEAREPYCCKTAEGKVEEWMLG